MRRALGMILIAALVVLAGCSGVLGGGGGGPTETVTPAAVPTDEPTPTPAPRLAPGITGEGIENPSVLVAAHKSFFENRSFTIRWNSTALAANGSVLNRETSMIYVGPPDEGFRIPSERNDSGDDLSSETGPVSTEWWSGGERVFLKQTYANGTTAYDRVGTDAERFRNSLATWGIFSLESFGTANTTITEQFTRNGRTLYRVRGAARTEEWGNMSLKLLVDSRGIIYETRTAREIPFSYNISRSVVKTQFVAVNQTDAPERPSWVDDALNQTTSTASSGTELAG
jgi:hypothetical protein